MWKDSETELDFLDYNYLVNSIKDIVQSDNLLPACVGVYGDWGSGKSSLIRMCKLQLEKEDKNIKCLIFNGWLFESYEDAKTAILGEILDAIKANTTLCEKGKTILKALYKSIDKFKLLKNSLKFGVDFFLTGGIGTIAGLTINKVVEKTSKKLPDKKTEDIKQSVTDELDYKELREDIREFQKRFAELLEVSKISRLVVFIDELDRCRPDTILETLEAIKLFLFTGNTAFVLGADERHIAYAVKSKFKDIEGQEIDIGKEYLEKLVQYPIKIPRLDSKEVEIYIGCLLLQHEIEEQKFNTLIDAFHSAQAVDFIKASLSDAAKTCKIDTGDTLTIAHQLSTLLARGLNGNPRQCKRFLNMMDLRIRQASYKKISLDRRILAKIMMLEYFRINIFKKFATMEQDGILQSELKIVEAVFADESKANDVKNLKELKDYINDDWFKSWCKIEPALSGEDLNLYFYFSRTSLEERISLLISGLSPIARELLSKLMAEAETVSKKALNEAKEMPVHEVSLIIDAFGTQLLSMGKVSVAQMKTFLNLAEQNKDYWSQGMEILSRFTIEQLQSALASHIAQFAIKTDQKEKLLQICSERWASNKFFAKFIENTLQQEE